LNIISITLIASSSNLHTRLFWGRCHRTGGCWIPPALLYAML